MLQINPMSDQLGESSNPDQNEFDFEDIPAEFGDRFFTTVLKNFLDPLIAITELVANAYDAGASEVRVNWPVNLGDEFSISDNGWGMSAQKFVNAWKEVSWMRRQHQRGPVRVRVPHDDVVNIKRRPFGKNGLGRLSGFFLSDSYSIETSDGKEKTKAKVARSKNLFDICDRVVCESEEFGTTIRSTTSNRIPGYSANQIAEELGARFLADPNFRIWINDIPVEFDAISRAQLLPQTDTAFGSTKIWVLDQQSSRIKGLKGVRYTVGSRMVGNQEHPFDLRKISKSFVVDASIFEENVNPDWSQFITSEIIDAFKKECLDRIRAYLEKMGDLNVSNQLKTVISARRSQIESLPRASQKRIGKLAEAVKSDKMTISDSMLSWFVDCMLSIEESESGQELVRKLSSMSVQDHDAWLDILNRFEPVQISLVMDEIDRRLKYLEALENALNAPGLDELHGLQPVISEGLWVFGPEFDTSEFFSNTTLARIIEQKAITQLGSASEIRDRIKLVPGNKRRPDILVLPDASLSVHSTVVQDGSEERNNQALILELKSYGKEASIQDKQQLNDYIGAVAYNGGIRIGGTVSGFLICKVPPPGEKSNSGELEKIRWNLTVLTFDELIRKAERRLFGLRRRLQDLDIPTGVEEYLEAPMDSESLFNPIELSDLDSA
jgi:hypothetical protein